MCRRHTVEGQKSLKVVLPLGCGQEKYIERPNRQDGETLKKAVKAKLSVLVQCNGILEMLSSASLWSAAFSSWAELLVYLDVFLSLVRAVFHSKGLVQLLLLIDMNSTESKSRLCQSNVS